MFREALFNSDKYQYTMGLVAYKKGRDSKKSTFDVFFRKAPDGNNWAVVAGIKQVMKLIRIMNSDDFSQGEKYRMFCKLFGNENHEYADKLCHLKFTGDIYAMKDGEIVFPNEPVLRLEGPFLEVQILETPILSIINHAMAIATKSSRVVRAAKGIPVSAFGSRRAHGPWAAIYGDEAAYIGGCANVSNIMADILCGVPSTGTMAHSFVESYGIGKDAEYQAFHDFVEVNPVNANILLIDTYDVKNCGLPNAIKVFKEFNLEKRFLETGAPYGIRLDSGDLAYLSKYCRQILDQEGLTNARIMATNGLDEYLIKDLLDQGACIDGFGVGDAIATSKHNPCFGGVYKLAEIDGQPTIKLSEDTAKVINPGKKNVVRIYQNGEAKADLIFLKDEGLLTKLWNQEEITIRDEFDKFKTTTFEKGSYSIKVLLDWVVAHGQIKLDIDDLEYTQNARLYCRECLNKFSEEHCRLINPHYYKVDISDALYNLKTDLIKKIKESMK